MIETARREAPRCPTTGVLALPHKGWWLCPEPTTYGDVHLDSAGPTPTKSHEYGHAIAPVAGR